MIFIEWYEWEKPVMLEVIDQIPMNNEHVNSWIDKLSSVAFLNFTANFYQRCKQETTVKYFIVPAFPLSGKSNYVVEEFSAERQRAIISWDHYLTT